MGRIRTVKPELFHHEHLYQLEKQTGLPFRIFWVGMFSVCDREGRFRWHPNRIKSETLPNDEINAAEMLSILWREGFIAKYKFTDPNKSVTTSSRIRTEFDTSLYGFVPTWKSHQRVRDDEAKSILPDPNGEHCKIIEYSDQDASFNRSSVTNPQRTRHELGAGSQRTHAVELEMEVEGEMEVELERDISRDPARHETFDLFGVEVETKKPDAVDPSDDPGQEDEEPSGDLVPYEDKTPYAIYCEQYREKYGRYPDKDPGALKQLKYLVDHNGKARIKQLIEAMFKMPWQPIESEYHSLWMFKRELLKIAAYADRGELPKERFATGGQRVQNANDAVRASVRIIHGNGATQ